MKASKKFNGNYDSQCRRWAAEKAKEALGYAESNKDFIAEWLEEFRFCHDHLVDLRAYADGADMVAAMIAGLVEATEILVKSGAPSAEIRESIKKEARQIQTKPARDTRNKNAKANDPAIVTALREIEKNVPLKRGVKYIETHVRGRLRDHLPPGTRIPSASKIKKITSQMKCGFF
jgi:hypothetical protein